jgi:choline dehydrogenase-like flavoprotein
MTHYHVHGARGEDPTEPHASAPYPYHRVTLRRDGNIQLSYEPTNQVPKGRLTSENDIPVAGVAHQAGTCRFGLNPATSVLNTDCRAHGVDNLYVVDTSFFPSIGAVNPALTAMANALRGDHLLERLGATNHEVAGVG